MRIILWPDSPKTRIKGTPYRAGDLCRWDGREWVCTNSHRYGSPIAPGTSCLWAEVSR